jgi:hypothetical protein
MDDAARHVFVHDIDNLKRLLAARVTVSNK